ncbi:hypothetical protein [Actinoplanes friuliensis]|uniref:Uncharacterized protein n=1 Tax=Actinoplanes friuliensis DSM 7358 TaxID=1246995 RepID=U5WC99_9ACTN|nr:hypothetical protein [Actinoplanes friuliensis]AGZ45546.1 hypothetical protein AFR_36450 [Actinoplanes friuliensis DSM 7358]
MTPEIWRLHAVADDTLLGELRVHERDWPWVHAKFEPAPAFAPLRPLFDEEARLVEADGPVEVWEAVYDRVRAAVRLADPDGVCPAEFILHVEGDDAWWRHT